MKWRKVLIVTLIAISILLAIALPFLTMGNGERLSVQPGENRIVVITLSGTIQEAQGGFLAGGISPALVHQQLGRAAADSSIKGVVLRVDSPGGAIAASQAIAAMVKEFEKPIVVSMGDMAASGGYYISAPAQGIVAHPGTITGSIGVISTVLNLDGFYEMLGIEVETVKSGEQKDMYSRTPTPEERALMQTLSDKAHEQFIIAVAEGRGMDIEAVRELATGQLFLGSQALEVGLVDRLGGIEEAIAFLAEMNDLENAVRYEFPPPSLFDQLSGFGFRALAALERALVTPELIMLEMLREGFPPEIRYQVR